MAKHAFLLLSSPESPGKLANPLTYAAQLHDAGHEVAVYFDGDATTFFDGVEDHAPPAVEAYEGARERGLVAGVCDHCANAKGVADAVEAEGFEIDGSEHSPDTAALVEDGFELHMV
ncbi:DsrE family protein [Haloarcula salinisoli]|uniref:DsrE family protein n=1 Tax=Haloarcula salinisoli TaxID=2487746 RepID=A0A8J8CA73_9EURY|nr:DsrE family protein [Halomicroarcula salinisoli]MBX0285809.1 DsrE family protein [Halomicroarcula salinisoli]MBX0302698.1 DsrE family protein [Halomicroarcula salinisoli]